MIWFVSAAMAGVIFSESELETYCVDGGQCPVVVGEVIDAECLGEETDSMGAIITEYGATIRVIEDTDGIGIGDQFELRTTNYDYTNAYTYPGCYETDPGHPIGEVARYYLDPLPQNGVYFLFDSETFYPTKDSHPDEGEICDSSDTEETVHDGPESETSEAEESGGCSTVSSPLSGWVLLLAPLAIGWRRQGAL